jgi:hypothetical protein
MKKMKQEYLANLRIFEAEPTARHAEDVDVLYRQLKAKGVKPWLCTQHKPEIEAPEGCHLIEAGSDAQGIYHVWQDNESGYSARVNWQ